MLALLHHPDKNNGDKEAEAKFQGLKVSFKPRIKMLLKIYQIGSHFCVFGFVRDNRFI